MKRLLQITFATLLSTLMLVETVGIYIIEDVCAPCGTSLVAVEILPNMETELTCESHEQTCQLEEIIEQCACGHEDERAQDEEHKHQQEQYYFNESPDFFSQNETLDFDLQQFAVLIPLLTLVLEDDFASSHQYGAYPPPLPSQMDHYRSLLCTYLI